MSQITPSIISEALNARAELVVKMLLPGGKEVAGEWCAGSLGGDAGKSLKVCMKGSKTGVWSDFADGISGGDLLDLWAAVRGMSIGDAMRDACDYLGIREPSFPGARPRREYKLPEKPQGTKLVDKVEPVLSWLTTVRKITQPTLQKYSVCAKDQDTILFPYLRDGKLIHMKFRSVREKKFWSSAETEKCLFGWQAVDPKARAIVITEGELDALAMFEYGFAALSVPYGGGKAGKQDWIDSEFDNLLRFDMIYLCMDSDEAGIEALAEIIDRLGRHRCKVVTLPKKDANDCLMAGVPKDVIVRAMVDAKTLDPRELRNAGEYLDAVERRFYPPAQQVNGFYLPWNRLRDKFVCEWGVTTIVAGYNGHGKTQLASQVAVDAIRQGVRSCVASLEFKPDKWLARMYRQIGRTELPTREHIHSISDWVSPNLWVFDVPGRGAGTAKIDKILEVFEYARQRYGIKLFIIDNFSKLGIGEDDLNGQKAAITNITEFAVEHDVHVLLVNHMRKAEDDHASAGKHGIRGSGAIGDLVDNIWVLWRDRKKEAMVKQLQATIHFGGQDVTPADLLKAREELKTWMERGDAVLSCEKYRNGDEEPRIRLWFDRASTQFVDEDNGAPRIYV